MMRIRKEQMDVLSKYMLKQFKDRMEVHLRTTFPEKTKSIPQPGLQTMIRTGIEKAARYQINIENDVQRYLEHMIRYGLDFDTNSKSSWAGDILRTENLDGWRKMDLIDKYARQITENEK